MRFARTTAAAAVLVLCLAAPNEARADDTGVNGAIPYALAGLGAGLFDVGFTVYDTVHLVSGERMSKTLGIIELGGALPQVGVAMYLHYSITGADGVPALTLIWAGWAAALAAHGIWTIVNPAEPQTAAPSASSPNDRGNQRVDAPRSLAGTRLDPPMWSTSWRF